MTDNTEHNENLRRLAGIYSKKVDGTMQGGFYGSTAEALETSAKSIEELEAKLAEYKHVASAIDKQWAESQDEIADLKANLAKAIEALGEAIYLLDPDEEDIAKETGLHRIVTTYAELTGGNDE